MDCKSYLSFFLLPFAMMVCCDGLLSSALWYPATEECFQLCRQVHDVSHTWKAHCNWKQHLCELLLRVKAEVDWALCTSLCVQSYCKLYWKPWHFAVFPFFNFPGLVFHDTMYSLLRNSPAFLKAPHLESDAQLLPGLSCVRADVCVYHPWVTRDMSVSLSTGGQLCPSCTPIPACLSRLWLTVGASDRILFHSLCSLLPLMHGAGKGSWLLFLLQSFSEKKSRKHGTITSDQGLQTGEKSCIIIILKCLLWLWISQALYFVLFNFIQQYFSNEDPNSPNNDRMCSVEHDMCKPLLWLTGENAGRSNLVSWSQ